MRRLYQRDSGYVWRIYDPAENRFCRSGRALYKRGRSMWNFKSSAAIALKNMPPEVRDRLVIKKFKLVEVPDAE